MEKDIPPFLLSLSPFLRLAHPISTSQDADDHTSGNHGHTLSNALTSHYTITTNQSTPPVNNISQRNHPQYNAASV